VTPLCLVGGYRHFRGIYCIHLHLHIYPDDEGSMFFRNVFYPEMEAISSSEMLVYIEDGGSNIVLP
jgi:diadenosine tetraphosphate (Ap4A) HIT family hydrolase